MSAVLLPINSVREVPARRRSPLFATRPDPACSSLKRFGGSPAGVSPGRAISSQGSGSSPSSAICISTIQDTQSLISSATRSCAQALSSSSSIRFTSVSLPAHLTTKAVRAADSLRCAGSTGRVCRQAHQSFNRTHFDGSRDLHASTVTAVQLVRQPCSAIESLDTAPVQREMPLLKDLGAAHWVPDAEVAKWHDYRDAVVWCWLNQRHYIGMAETARRTLFANHAGMHAPHASRCFKPDAKSPMDLPQRCIKAFETFTGWRGVRQFQLKDGGLTAMEQVIEQRRVA